MQPIRVWRFSDAPAELQFGDNGGDEDWLALVPPEYADEWIGWLDSGGAFGCCGVNQYRVLKDGNVERRNDRDFSCGDGKNWELTDHVLPLLAGSLIYIGCHA